MKPSPYPDEEDDQAQEKPSQERYVNPVATGQIKKKLLPYG